MEVRWRLFARDVLSMPADGESGDFMFGCPPRPVRGLRMLGIIVHKSRAAAAEATAAAAGVAGRGAADIEVGSDGDIGDGRFGLLGVDDGTGVIIIRLPLHLWESVGLSDQVDIVGVPEWTKIGLHSGGGGGGQASGRCIRAEGCYVETDPNVATLRALECINLYKVCYFSRAWSSSAVPFPPLLPDPYEDPAFQLDGNLDVDGGGEAGGEGTRGAEAGRGDDEGASLEERLLTIFGRKAGGVTAEELCSDLRVPPGDEGLQSALAQMQLDGAIYVTGDRYMLL